MKKIIVLVGLLGVFASCVELDEAASNPENCLVIKQENQLQFELNLVAIDADHDFRFLLDGVSPEECGIPFARCLKSIQIESLKIKGVFQFDSGDRPESLDFDAIEIDELGFESTRLQERDVELTWENDLSIVDPLSCTRLYRSQLVIDE